jgi:hypothetical protein
MIVITVADHANKLLSEEVAKIFRAEGHTVFVKDDGKVLAIPSADKIDILTRWKLAGIKKTEHCSSDNFNPSAEGFVDAESFFV